ncbi:hypothetical protein KPATCC21470_6729 [Kitasatospora purpeofusca]
MKKPPAEEVPVCSPRLRGWSRPAGRGRRQASLLPAPAGLVPPSADFRPRTRPAPRACGVGPFIIDYEHNEPILLPAPAGLVP